MRSILNRVRKHAAKVHAPAPFVPGQSFIPYAGQQFGADEIAAGVEAMLQPWITLGPQGHAFEAELAAAVGMKASVLCNSGSSANLLAVSLLSSHKNSPRGRLLPGDEIITAAAGFPTTVFPIIQCGAVPVFIDSDPATGNIRPEQLEAALSPRTKAVMIAHVLGNPFDIAAVKAFCEKHDLWLIEDNCDALGSLYDGQPTGSFGHVSTQSFYPPHHLTMGEGGAVNVCSLKFRALAESFRDWGRDCWCACGHDNTCRNRFNWQLGELPEGYDHKYIYSHLGYNLKPLDVQAAIGRIQLLRLPAFTAARRANWQRLHDGLGHLFPTMVADPRSQPSWFGFMLRTPRRAELVAHLDRHKIGHRMLFGGNLVRQPVFCQLKKDRPDAFRVVGDLAGADELMHTALFLGTYPGLTPAMLDYEIDTITEFAIGRSGSRPAPYERAVA